MRATCRVRLLVARRSANLRTVMGAVVCWLAGGLGLALERIGHDGPGDGRGRLPPPADHRPRQGQQHEHTPAVPR